VAITAASSPGNGDNAFCEKLRLLSPTVSLGGTGCAAGATLAAAPAGSDNRPSPKTGVFCLRVSPTVALADAGGASMAMPAALSPDDDSAFLKTLAFCLQLSLPRAHHYDGASYGTSKEDASLE
jgi:hypothetical protein